MMTIYLLFFFNHSLSIYLVGYALLSSNTIFSTGRRRSSPNIGTNLFFSFFSLIFIVSIGCRQEGEIGNSKKKVYFVFVCFFFCCTGSFRLAEGGKEKKRYQLLKQKVLFFVATINCSYCIADF